MVRRSCASPVWDITEADWIDYRPNRRFATFSCTTNVVNDAVLDKETELVWERSPSSDKPVWDAAIVYSYTKALVGRKGWRLPAIEELLSLVDPTQTNPTLPVGNPFNNIKTDDFYWSSTLGMSSPPSFAWGYNLGNGDTSNVLKSAGAYAWLVRGGFGHDYPF